MKNQIYNQINDTIKNQGYCIYDDTLIRSILKEFSLENYQKQYTTDILDKIYNECFNTLEIPIDDSTIKVMYLQKSVAFKRLMEDIYLITNEKTFNKKIADIKDFLIDNLFSLKTEKDIKYLIQHKNQMLAYENAIYTEKQLKDIYINYCQRFIHNYFYNRNAMKKKDVKDYIIKKYFPNLKVQSPIEKRGYRLASQKDRKKQTKVSFRKTMSEREDN